MGARPFVWPYLHVKHVYMELPIYTIITLMEMFETYLKRVYVFKAYV
jgi:hypothetical protein